MAAATLYDQLVRPLAPIIDDADVLYVVPDRFLNALPFAALYDRRDGRYLIQKHRIILTPSGMFLRRRVGLKRRMQPALVIADPTSASGGKRLNEARRDAAEIATLFGAPPPLIGPKATVGKFTVAAPKSALIVYAGHAQGDDTAGGFLPLAPTGDTDGRMDVTAISALPLRRTHLVILYACATMRGDPQHIEGMPSLSRGFLNAGVPAVIGMLWKVDEHATSRLLRPFFVRLEKGIPPSQALRAAQLAAITSDHPELRDPSVWAAAELLGVD